MIEEEDDSWRGFPLDEIYDGYSIFEDRNEAPKLEESENHTILFPLADSQPKHNIWDDNHVKLPNNPESCYFEIDSAGNKVKKFRWELIKKSLTAEKIENSRDLEKSIKMYNTKFEETWHFTSLHQLFEEEFLETETEYFFDKVLPRIIDIAMRLEELIVTPIPLLSQKMNHSISMTKEQAACLLANAFLCTFPKRNGPRKNTDYPEINFNRLFGCSGSNVVEKIKCICNYFRRVLVVGMPKGIITFQRRHIELDEFPKWEDCDLKFSSIKWHIDSYGRIETSQNMLQMDFANRYLGGGVLGYGCVQEEIKFMIKPECIVGMLFCASMKTTEAILIYGVEQFSKYSGYSGAFKWEGNFVDELPFDQHGRKLSHIVAVDALPFRNPYMQFEEKLIRRDVNKAFCGFYRDPANEKKGVPVAGGFWGCGAFGGFNKLKALIELIACVGSRRNLVFYTFGNEELVDEMHNMFSYLSANDISVGQLWSYLAVFKSLNKKFDEFYQFIYDQHRLSQSLEQIYLSNSREHMFASENVTVAHRQSADGSSLYESQEFSSNYVDQMELENPSKRTKTDYGDSYEESDKSDIGSEIEISQNYEPQDEDGLDEIIVVSNAPDEQNETEPLENEQTLTRTDDDCNDMVDCSNVQSAEFEKEESNKNAETVHIGQKTILDYFKPKSSDFS